MNDFYKKKNYCRNHFILSNDTQDNIHININLTGMTKNFCLFENTSCMKTS